jgi:hypothetical protein
MSQATEKRTGFAAGRARQRRGGRLHTVPRGTGAVPTRPGNPEQCAVRDLPRDGIEWHLELITDEAAEGGLRAVWADPEPKR